MTLTQIRRTLLPAVLVLAAAIASPRGVQAGTVYINNNYHGQVTNYFCGAATMEMMLDTPAVTSTNPAVVSILAPGDGGYVPQNPFPATPNAGAQTSIYSLVHGGAFAAGSIYTGSSVYNNPAYGPGTDPFGFVNGLNTIDNPTNPNNAAASAATGNPGNQGNHAYSVWMTAPTLTGGIIASNTVAKAIAQFNVPASVSINNGGHWIDVNGVTLNNTNTAITGFYIRDPWTGYANNYGLANRGLGINTWLRYGYDVRANSTTRFGGAWFNYFNPATNTANAGAGVGYTIEVEPQGPESLDTGDTYYTDPVPMLESSEINASTAVSDAIAGLTADGLNSDFTGDNPDTSNSDADEMLMSMPGDQSGEGDWLVPYDGPGGVNDVAGFAMIDADTGVIDQATWFDGADMPLSDVDNMFGALAAGIEDPSDNAVPEPSSLILLGLGAAGSAWVVVRQRR